MILNWVWLSSATWLDSNNRTRRIMTSTIHSFLRINQSDMRQELNLSFHCVIHWRNIWLFFTPKHFRYFLFLYFWCWCLTHRSSFWCSEWWLNQMSRTENDDESFFGSSSFFLPIYPWLVVLYPNFFLRDHFSPFSILLLLLLFIPLSPIHPLWIYKEEKGILLLQLQIKVYDDVNQDHHHPFFSKEPGGRTFLATHHRHSDPSVLMRKRMLIKVIMQKTGKRQAEGGLDDEASHLRQTKF